MRPAAASFSTFAAAVAALCGVHCVLTPLAVALLPLAGLRHLFGPLSENVLVVTALASTTFGLGWGIRVHGRWFVLAGLLCAGGLFVASRLLPEGPGERILVGGASLVLFASLVWNHRECRHCTRCREAAT